MTYGKCSKLHGINTQLHTRLTGKEKKEGKGVKSRRLVGAEWSARPKTETPKTLVPVWKLLSSSASALLFSSPPSPGHLLYNSPPVFTSYHHPRYLARFHHPILHLTFHSFSSPRSIRYWVGSDTTGPVGFRTPQSSPRELDFLIFQQPSPLH